MQITISGTQLLVAACLVAAYFLIRALVRWLGEIGQQRLDTLTHRLLEAISEHAGKHMASYVDQITDGADRNASIILGKLTEINAAMTKIMELAGAVSSEFVRQGLMLQSEVPKISKLMDDMLEVATAPSVPAATDPALIQKMDALLHFAKEISITAFAMRNEVAAQTKVIESDPGPQLDGEKLVALLGQVRDGVQSLPPLLRSTLDQNKRLMQNAFGIEAGDVEEDEIIEEARALCRDHRGLKLEDAMKRLREVRQYRPASVGE